MSRSRGRRDDTTSIANSVVGPRPPLVSPSTYDLVKLLAVEDYRQWHPDGSNRAPRNVWGAPVGYRSTPRRRPDRFGDAIRRSTLHGWSRSQIGFQNPLNVVTCLRRKARREVMFALKLHRKRGKGGGRKNWRSFIRC